MCAALAINDLERGRIFWAEQVGPVIGERCHVKIIARAWPMAIRKTLLLQSATMRIKSEPSRGSFMIQPRHIESPCISVCQLNEETGYCTGCWRTREEIAAWSKASSESRLQILEKLHERRDQARGVSRRRTRRRESAD